MTAAATMKRPGLATIVATIATAFSGIATIFRYGIAALPLYPAARINWDAGIAQHDTTQAIAGIAIAVGGAICIENARHSWFARQRGAAAGWGTIGLILLVISFSNALGNFSASSDHSRDVRTSQQSTAATLSAQRSQLAERRKAQVAIIAKPLQSVRGMQLTFTGEEAVKSLEGEIEATKTAKAYFWRTSEGCKAEKVFSPEGRTYCEEIATLEGKKAAAEKRDQIDTDLRKIDSKTEGAEVPSSVDSFSDAIAGPLALIGYDVGEKGRLFISRVRDFGRALGVEILGFFLPAGILQLFARGGVPKSAGEPQPQAQRKPATKATVAPIVAQAPESLPATVPAMVATSQDDPELAAFRDARLEIIHGEDTRSTPVYEAWRQHCADRGIEVGSQKAFCQRLQALGVGYTRQGNRPRYLNVRLKAAQHHAAHAPLRLAVVNG